MTVTAPVVPHSPQRGPHRRTVQIVIAVLALMFLLAPMAYLIGQLWTVTGKTSESVAAERAAIAYARPLNRLLTALVDAQYAAVRRTEIDASSARAAVDEVDGVDRQFTDLLQVRQRWIRLKHEIDTTLAQNPSGPGALRAYATPIALTQALLDRVADSAKATGDPGSGSYQLIHVALQRLPDVVAAAGQVAALAFTTPGGPAPAQTAQREAPAPANPQWAVAVDRLARAADDVGIGLRAGTDPAAGGAVDLRLLGLLDEFAAASDELSQTAAGLDVPRSGVQERIDAASTQLRIAAVALETAVLDAVNAELSVDVSEYSAQRWILALAGVAVPLAAVALLWLRIPGRAASRTGASAPAGGSAPANASGSAAASSPPGTPGESGPLAGQRSGQQPGYPADGVDGRPDAGERIPNLVDARELLGPELVHAGRIIRARKRREHDDPQ